MAWLDLFTKGAQIIERLLYTQYLKCTHQRDHPWISNDIVCILCTCLTCSSCPSRGSCRIWPGRGRGHWLILKQAILYRHIQQRVKQPRVYRESAYLPASKDAIPFVKYSGAIFWVCTSTRDKLKASKRLRQKCLTGWDEDVLCKQKKHKTRQVVLTTCYCALVFPSFFGGERV